MTRGGQRYYLNFINDFSRYKNEVENQLSKKIKKGTNRGGEYDSSMINVYYENLGIIYEVTPFYSPKSNGMAKEKKTLKNMVNTMLINYRALSNLWEKVVNTTIKIEYLVKN